ncbi:hypothetical protein BK138_34100 [Paenibacillus rhizosphaerae]|uniref:Uncharacterized protein n=1 Tax=Paenibacillus rhizosphaerae TaxID=297318 RepID=A0A1R1DZH5_9BACL|nr:hypothetical protein BK138_34100 [Paenibacillus rhizosphaerae]
MISLLVLSIVFWLVLSSAKTADEKANENNKRNKNNFGKFFIVYTHLIQNFLSIPLYSELGE